MIDVQLGAHFIKPGIVRFRIWAPDCKTADLMIGGALTAMTRGDGGIFEIQKPCAAGVQYMYRLDGVHVVPDPAAHAQVNDVHDASIVVDHQYDWNYPDWCGRPWEETIIYELHAGSFGGFVGVKEQLPRLAELGITAIELMPIADFPGERNWGYDGVLPYAPDVVYGTPLELKELVEAAHGLNMQIFLDVVYNHFGPDGNYLGIYAGNFFRDDIHTPWGVAIDFRCNHVRRFFIENALYWLNDYRFDGLRFDAVHAINDDTFLTEMVREIRARTAGRHVHLIIENEGNQAELLTPATTGGGFSGQWADDWHHCMHVLLTGESEGYYGDFQDPAAQLARCLSQGFAYQGEPSRHADGVLRGTPSAHLPTTAFVICLQNHDQIGNRAFGERLSTLAQPEALRAATALLLLTPQIPMLFMGDEWGEVNPFLFFTDHHSALAEAVLIGRREEFSEFAAFASDELRDKIPDPNAHATFTVSKALPPTNPTPLQARIIALHQDLLSLRRIYIVPHLVGTRSLGAIALGSFGVRATWQLGNGARLVIASNFGECAVACRHGSGLLLFQSAPASAVPNMLPGYATFAWIENS